MDRFNWFLELYPKVAQTTEKDHPDVLLAVTPRLKPNQLIQHKSGSNKLKGTERESLHETSLVLRDSFYDSLKKMEHPPQTKNDSDLSDWLYRILQNHVPAISLAYNATNIPTKKMLSQLLTMPQVLMTRN